MVTVTSYIGGWPGYNSAHRIVVLGKKKNRGSTTTRSCYGGPGSEPMTRFFWWGYKISFQELVSAEPYCHNTGTVCSMCPRQQKQMSILPLVFGF